MTDLKGLRASVYYNTSYRGCANGGISERAESVVIVGIRDQRFPVPTSEWQTVQPLPEGMHAGSVPTDDAPAVVIVYRNMGSTQLVHAEPYEPCPEGHVGYMSGGSYIGSTDGRFRELVGGYGVAIALHDRSETVAGYAALAD